MRRVDGATQRSWLSLVFTLTAAVTATFHPIGDARADALDDLALPPVPQTPWRFHGFPILSGRGPPGTATLADFQAYKDAGFTLHATNSDTGYDAALDYCTTIGLPSMSFMQPQGFDLPARASLDLPWDHPSIAGFILGDEPQSGAPMVTDIKAVNDRMLKDPSRFTFFNMLPPNLQGAPGTEKAIATAARSGMRMVSYDDYVIMDDGTENAEQFYGNLSLVRGAAATAGIPFWSFAVTVRHRGYLGTYRRPSESDLRWMHYSNLAYGAKGLWYFTYWAPAANADFDNKAIVSSTGEKTPLYDQVSALNHAVLAVGDTLLSLKSIDVVHTSPPFGEKKFQRGTRFIEDLHAKDALVGFFEDPAGKPYALVVNKRHGKDKTSASLADDITLTLAANVDALTAVSFLDGATGNLTIADDGTVALDVPGGTGVLLAATLGPPRQPKAPEEQPPADAPPDTTTSSSTGCAVARAGVNRDVAPWAAALAFLAASAAGAARQRARAVRQRRRVARRGG